MRQGDEPFKASLSGDLTHIIGIGGIGMSAIAEVMHARGLPVQGSDQKDGPNLRRLATQGIRVFTGHDPENLNGASEAVISSAVKPGNAELDAALAAGLTVKSRAAKLAELMQGFQTVSITGSHGKTTTTSMTAWMFEQAGLDPTALIGGIIPEWRSNARTGKSRWMIVEADESDATFIALPTLIGAVTNIDPEHLDYYGSIEALHEAFGAFFKAIPQHGLAIAGIDNMAVAGLIADLRNAGGAPAILTFGETPGADLCVSKIRSNGGSVRFDLIIRGGVYGEARHLADITLRVPGRHNALNAAAAFCIGLRAGLADSAIVSALESFGGVDRRFTQTGAWNGVAIFDDYAHHPAEIEAVLSAARGAAKGHVIAVMQPHRFSRLKALFDGFCTCFLDADAVFIAPVYAAGEDPNGVDRDTLVDGIKRAGHACVFPIDGADELASSLAALAKPGDLIINLGAGNITEWAKALPAQLNAHHAALGAAE